MIDELTITNLTTETSILLTKTGGHPYLIETDGISWGEAGATHNSYTNLTGVGDIIASTKINARSIAITGRVCSPHTNKEIARIYDVSSLEEIKAKREEEIESAKKILSQVVNPLNYMRLSIGDYYIQGKPTSSVSFSGKWKENNEIYCRFTFSLDCSDPLFHYKSQTEIPLSGIYGGFHFPVVIPTPNGMRFGTKISYQLINVQNTGDVPLGGNIFLKATGTVVNPKITNVYTQESIQINKTLSANEIVWIDTVNRKLLGSTNGGVTYSNYLQYWDFDNSWFQFDIGNTLFGYSAEDDSYLNLEVWIELNMSFYSMEDQ